MLPNVAMISRPAGPRVTSSVSADPSQTLTDLPADRRRAELAAEARRIARRRLIAESVALRSRENDRGLRADASAQLFRRAKRRATHLHLGFHRSIEVLWEAGGFDEALAIFREHKSEFARRTSRLAHQG
jgi:hypothetical protein